MRTVRRITYLSASVATVASMALAGGGVASAADVSLPAVEDSRVSVPIENPIPGKLGWPPVLGQSCAGALVPLYAIPDVAREVIPLLDGDIMSFIAALGDLNDQVNILLLANALVPSPATLPGVAGTLEAGHVRDDFYATPVVCVGGRDDAPMEINLFLARVGNPLGAFEGSVTGSVGGSDSAEGSSIGFGSAELGVGSADGMIELGSASGSDQGSTVDIGFHGSVADVTSGSLGVDADAGSSGSEAAAGSGQGSIDGASTGALDTSSLTGSAELPEGSSNGSSIDVGSIIPLAEGLSDSVGDKSFPGS